MPRAAASSSAARERSRRSVCVRACMYVCRIVDMRLPQTAHTVQPWRIHEIAHDFRLEDVWALPTPGGADDFPLLVEGAVAQDPERSPNRAVRTLFALRWKIGELLGLDGDDSGLGSRVPTLRDRLPAD